VCFADLDGVLVAEALFADPRFAGAFVAVNFFFVDEADAPLSFFCADFVDEVLCIAAVDCATRLPPIVNSNPAKTIAATRRKLFPSNIPSRSNPSAWRRATLARTRTHQGSSYDSKAPRVLTRHVTCQSEPSCIHFFLGRVIKLAIVNEG
jgi:hypothetical protein